MHVAVEWFAFSSTNLVLISNFFSCSLSLSSSQKTSKRNKCSAPFPLFGNMNEELFLTFHETSFQFRWTTSIVPVAGQTDTRDNEKQSLLTVYQFLAEMSCLSLVSSWNEAETSLPESNKNIRLNHDNWHKTRLMRVWQTQTDEYSLSTSSYMKPLLLFLLLLPRNVIRRLFFDSAILHDTLVKRSVEIFFRQIPLNREELQISGWLPSLYDSLNNFTKHVHTLIKDPSQKGWVVKR